ncbi:MAG: hypothetical protein ACLQAT_10045 [Candidatus Binataceae bacterium]
MNAVKSGWRGPMAARVILWIIAIVTPLYWIIFFATGNLTPSPSDFGYRFEIAFPAADLLMAAAAAIAAIGLARGARWGRAMALVTAGAALYLAGMDILFDLENGVYLLGRSQTAVEATINVSCVAFGIYLLAVMVPDR